MFSSFTFSLGVGRFALVALAISSFLCSGAARAQKVDKAKLDTAARRAGKAVQALSELSALPAGEKIPRELLERTRAVAVFPDVDRVNILVMKAMKGYGLMSRRLPEGWSMPAFYAFAVMDRGWTKVKPAEVNIIMLFLDEDTLKKFEKDRVDLKAAAGPVGELTAEKEKQVRGAGIIVYALAGRKLSGIEVEDDSSTQSGINSDNNINKAVYGMKASEVLRANASSASTTAPDIAEFRNALTNLWK